MLKIYRQLFVRWKSEQLSNETPLGARCLDSERKYGRQASIRLDHLNHLEDEYLKSLEVVGLLADLSSFAVILHEKDRSLLKPLEPWISPSTCMLPASPSPKAGAHMAVGAGRWPTGPGRGESQGPTASDVFGLSELLGGIPACCGDSQGMWLHTILITCQIDRATVALPVIYHQPRL